MGRIGIFLLLFFLSMAVGGAFCVFLVKRKLRQVSRAAFGTDSLLDGLREQEERIAETPRSVAGMTKIYLPRIEKDFPEFSYPEIVRRSENQLKEALAALESQDLSLLQGASGELRRQIAGRIEDQRRQGIREIFQNVRIHQTEITRYEKRNGSCILTLQSAVEYRYGRGTEPKRVQTRYNMEWVYVQDVEKLPGDRKAVGINCPNCGAPVKALGARTCEYCGAVLEALSLRVWSLNQIEES